MWSTLALAAALAPAQQPAGGLQLGNVRITVGELGPTRPDNKLLPGDILFVGYDIEGITIDGDGFARYTIAMTVFDKANKPFFKQDPRELADLVPLRGNRIPARAFITIGLDTEPGPYTCEVTVTDSKTKMSNKLAVKFEVLPKDFAVVAVYTSHDEKGAFSAPTTGVAGQTVFIQFSVASFQRDPKTKQPNVEFEFQVTDEKGNPTLGKPRTHIQDSGVDEKEGAFAMRFPVFMSRPGKFTVKITATDKVANKKATYELPLTVLQGN